MSDYEEIMKLALERGFYFPTVKFMLMLQQASGNMVQMELVSRTSSLICGEERL